MAAKLIFLKYNIDIITPGSHQERCVLSWASAIKKNLMTGFKTNGSEFWRENLAEKSYHAKDKGQFYNPGDGDNLKSIFYQSERSGIVLLNLYFIKKIAQQK